MTPGVLRPIADEQNLEKQMGCMAGFLQIFDRNQLISGKRIYAPKRIPSFPATESSSPSEKSDLSSKEASEMMFPSSPENFAETPVKSPVLLPAFDFKEGMKNSWKLREAPRLSLDSRLRPRDIRTSPAIYSPGQSNADSDKNRRSPSVVARLMGLDALPDAGDSTKKAELQRSASESRVSRDVHRFVEGSIFQKPPPLPLAGDKIYNFRSFDFSSESTQKPAPAPTKLPPSIGRSSFNAQDFFPGPRRSGSRSLYGEIEKRLRIRGIDDPAKDLEALKQILEALQLKDLLHSYSNSNSNSNPPIVVMKPIPKPVKRSDRRSPFEEKRVRCRNAKFPDPNTRRNGRVSAVQSSPKSSPRSMTPPEPITARSPRNRRLVRERVTSPAEDDAATTISESSVSSSLDIQRARMGQNLLERCNKLLNSIAAFTSVEQLAASDQQPSPVSVLDSSFLGEESSPSPVTKRSLDFKDWEDLTIGSRPDYVPESEYPDFAYVSNVVPASDRYPDYPSDVYHFLEKGHGATDASPESIQHRRLIFDAVHEILSRKRNLSAWESFSKRCHVSDAPPQQIREVWREVRTVKVEVATEDLNAVACGAIRKDVEGGDHGWGDSSPEMSETVLNLERLVFKDLVGELIRDLADLAGNKTRNPLPRRKLLF